MKTDKMRIAINGTGRIGLCACRLLGEREDVELVAMNTTMPIETLVHLLRYDSVHGFCENVSKIADDEICVGKQQKIKILSERDPSKLEFGKSNAQIVLECTGVFKTIEKASAHLRDGVQKVVVSSPSDDQMPTFVYGVNHKFYNQEAIISNASCTTNALAPLVKILHEAYQIKSGLMTTIHSYTNDQNLLDVKHKDVRRARAAAMNMIPTSTGAAKAIGLVIPELQGRLNGFSVRVPTPNVSLIDFNFETEQKVNKDQINHLLREKSRSDFSGIVLVDDDKRVSSDFIGFKESCIVASDCTLVLADYHAKVIAWYDNEMGYTSRLIDMACFIG